MTDTTTEMLALADWADPQVQNVYKILCDETEPPNNDHWEGFVARRIVAALRHLASQPSSYEAGRETKPDDGSQDGGDWMFGDVPDDGVYTGDFRLARPIAALPVDGGTPDDGSCVRCSAVPRTASGLCNTCLDEDAERAGEIATPSTAGSVREALEPTRHHYSPDYQAMGDCRVCGHTYDSPLHIGSPADHVASHSVGRSPTLSAPVEAPVAVKPLEWRDHRPDSFPEPAWSAQTPFGFYNIEEVSASDSPGYVVRLHAHHFIADKDSLDEAKAAAQADYEQRILSAIDTGGRK